MTEQVGDHDEHTEEHEVAHEADRILEDAKLDYSDAMSDDDAVRYATDIAAANLKFGRKNGIEAARAALRVAAASVTAPELRAERDEAERAAKTDALTGLANQAALAEALPSAEANPNVAIISFDGDNFGAINKNHHNAAGDAAIIALAKAVTEAAADNGTNRVFRGGGDEFYVLGSPDKAERMIAEAKRLMAERIASGEPFSDAQGETYPPEWYADLGLSGSTGKTRVEADEAMYLLKKANKEAKTR